MSTFEISAEVYGVTDQYADDLFILEISTNQTRSDTIDLLANQSNSFNKKYVAILRYRLFSISIT